MQRAPGLLFRCIREDGTRYSGNSNSGHVTGPPKGTTAWRPRALLPQGDPPALSPRGASPSGSGSGQRAEDGDLANKAEAQRQFPPERMSPLTVFFLSRNRLQGPIGKPSPRFKQSKKFPQPLAEIHCSQCNIFRFPTGPAGTHLTNIWQWFQKGLKTAGAADWRFFFLKPLIWTFYFTLFIYIWPCHVARRILVPDQGSNPRPLHWKRGALTTGPPGKSRRSSF